MAAAPTALRYRLAHTVKLTAPPPIPLAKAWGLAYPATPTKPLIDLSQGVPGVPPPPELLHALGEAALNPISCEYGPMNGEVSMRKALAEEMKVIYGADADIRYDDVSLTAGCNMSFLAVAMTLAGPGDEVILPVPWYFNHQMSLQMLGVNAIPLPCYAPRGFLPSASDCAKLITPRSRAIVLVTPNNPTGAIFPPELLSEFACLAKEHGLALVIDETYRDLILSGAPHSLFSPRSPSAGDWAWRETFIHLFSFSKSYCVPGHRLGAIVAAPTFLAEANKVLDSMQICPPRAIQLALHALLPALRPHIRAAAQALAQRHALFRAVLPRGWALASQGGYYAFVRHPFRGVAARGVCARLAREMGVVALPGAFFGLGGRGAEEDEDADAWIRFSVANVGEDALRRVGERLAECAAVFGWSAAGAP